MRISIIGTGAIGGYYGIMLAKAGYTVDFLLRSDYEHVKTNGLKLYSDVHGYHHLPEVNVYHDVTQMPAADLVLVALKTTQNKELLPRLLPSLMNDQNLVLLVQNGLGMEEDLAQQFPEWQIAGGTALIAAHKEQPGVIIHQDYGNLDIGGYRITNTAILDRFSAHFFCAGIPSSHQPLNYLRWKKLVWNMAFNGLSVVLNQTTDQILTNAQSRKRCISIMDEVIQAANACGVALHNDLAEEMISFTEKMNPYAPSMKLDYDLGRPMELHYMYEKPIAMAQLAGYSMSETVALHEELHQLNSVKG